MAGVNILSLVSKTKLESYHVKKANKLVNFLQSTSRFRIALPNLDEEYVGQVLSLTEP